MGASTVLLLRFFHVTFGALWVGAVVFIAAFLIPSIRAAGPGGSVVMQQLMQARKLSLWLMALAVVAVLSGLGLYWHDSAGFQSAWLGSGPGRVFGMGGGFALAAMVTGMSVNAPAGRRLGILTARIQAEGRLPTPDEVATLQALQQRLARGGNIVALLVVLATMAMAVARYVP